MNGIPVRSASPALGSLRALVAVLTFTTVPAVATDTWFDVSPGGAAHRNHGAAARAPGVIVEWYDDTGLGIRVEFPGLELAREATEAGWFVRVSCPGTPQAGQAGMPALPVVRRLFGAPPEATVDLVVREGRSALIDLRAAGFGEPVIPMRGPISLDRDGLGVSFTQNDIPPSLRDLLLSPFRLDDTAYAADALLPAEPVAIRKLGLARGMQLYLLEVWPAAYNPARGTLSVWPRMQVELHSRGTYAANQPRRAAGLTSVVLNPPRRGRARDGGLGNYLIVTPPDFYGSAPLVQLADAKTAQGFNVMTYEVPVGTHRNDIRAYTRSLRGTPDEPDYILIVGDALDSTGYSGPYSIPVCIGGGTRHGRTDLPYACLDDGDDWFPEAAVGRFPLRLESDLQCVVDKTLCVDAGNYVDPTYPERAIFMAGTDPFADAETRHNWIIETYMQPNGIQSNRIYAGDGADTEDIANALNAGCFLGCYFGHAAGHQAWGHPYFDFDDIENLTNEGMYPFIASFTCSAASFHHMVSGMSPGFLEKFLRVCDKGLSGGYGTTTVLEPYTWATWGDLYKFLWQAIYHDGVREVGPATQTGIAHFVAFYGLDDPVSRDYAELFVLLGDPSLRLPEPPPDNYLIIAAEDYVGSTPLNELISAKQALRFNVSTYSVPSGTSNAAIKSYIQSLWGTPDAPDYILLVGDTDGFYSTSNTVPHWEGGGDQHAPTDWPYACMDTGDDWYPEIPIGRFSVRSLSSLQDVVDKTLAVESGQFPDPDYIKRGAFLANSSTYGQAEPTHDWVIDTYFTPNNYEGIKLYAAEGADTQDVADAINSGCLFAVYFGHSNSNGWWEPAFFRSDVASLSNTGLYGLVFGFSCNTARYTSSECFGETWLRAPEKGAAAYLSASDETYWSSEEDWLSSVVLEKSFLAAFFEDNIWEIGPAWVAGLYRFLAEYGDWDGDPSHPPTQHADVCRNYLEEFVLLGDPALRLPQPDAFTLGVSPPSLDVCAPAEAVYDISVGRTGHFIDVVTLSAMGTPPGTTVDFSANTMSPPFTAMMTIGDTASGTPGNYDVQVVATGGSLERMRLVRLSLANAAPGDFVLVSPSDGATDVPLKPTLTWEESSQAARYELQVATDEFFGHVVYSTLVGHASHTLTTPLAQEQLHYWRVRAENGCDTTDYTDAFSFTTADQVDAFAEQFAGSPDSFDLDGLTLCLIPDGSADYYEACLLLAEGLPTDPGGGELLNLEDNGSQLVTPSSGPSLYGVEYYSFYVNANGNISFTTSDSTPDETLEIHFGQPRISALFDDLNPENGGTISWKETGDCVAVTWENVPEWSDTGTNTFQVEMLFNGEIHVTWWGVDSDDSIVGLSQGTGIPGDYIEYDLSAAPPCPGPPIGACCIGEACQVLDEAECLAAAGEYQGDGTTCEPNPCATYESECVIITEVVQGTESGDCPRWIEITNTGARDFAFFDGGVIVQTDDSNDVWVDIDLTGVTIMAGKPFVINSNADGICTGAFYGVYHQDADLYTQVPFGFGDERFILTDAADGSHLLDIYGEFGVNGSGQPWEFTDGYSCRLPDANSGSGGGFAPDEWYLGGVGSLAGENPTQLLLDNTSPGTHEFNELCGSGLPGDLNDDGCVDQADLGILLADWGCSGGVCSGDCDDDGDTDQADLGILLAYWGEGCD